MTQHHKGEEGVKLTKAQARVLGIFGRIDGKNRLHWGTPKTSRELAAMGLLEAYLPPSVAERPRMKARPYRITEAGRATLASTHGASHDQ